MQMENFKSHGSHTIFIYAEGYKFSVQSLMGIFKGYIFLVHFRNFQKEISTYFSRFLPPCLHIIEIEAVWNYSRPIFTILHFLTPGILPGQIYFQLLFIIHTWTMFLCIKCKTQERDIFNKSNYLLICLFSPPSLSLHIFNVYCSQTGHMKVDREIF